MHTQTSGLLHMHTRNLIDKGQEYDEWIPVTDVIGQIHVEPSDVLPVATYDLHRIKIKIKENMLLTCRIDTLINIKELISIHFWSSLSPQLEMFSHLNSHHNQFLP